MSGVNLFLRARRSAAVALIATATGILIWLCGPIAISLHPTDSALNRVSAMLPVAPAILLTASLNTPLAAKERLSGRNLETLRLSHTLIQSTIIITLCSLGSWQLPPGDQGMVSTSRNAAALIGSSLLGNAILGPRIGWLISLAWVIIPPLLIPRPYLDPSQLFTLISQPDDSFHAFIYAIVIWILGISAASKEWSLELTRISLH